MWRRTMLPFAAITALAISAPASAQEASAPVTPAPASPAPAPAPRSPAYSDSQMQDFARATVELQALGSQDPAAMTRAIEGAGMRVEDYNSMGDAMRADPKLAASLNPYLDTANVERTARLTREATQGLDRRWSPPPRHAASARKSASRHALGKGHAHKGKAATSRHHAAKRTGHAAASSHASRHRHRKR